MIPIPLIIEMAAGAFKLGKQLYDSAKQSKELTPEQDAQLEAIRKAAYEDPAWQPQGELKIG